ncbi:hypothetical protein LX32DRAFT_419972 [Colletotrichum zoysiae]|uniref:Uncharacterized protein n=1 Tax=Colletotrichum zoysiae TaxID=1216348 RepID=A0AAD9HU34_9PEZI|nr:hypothetical protein LX32DRAFT_419972 [Colletotrichum zoysiae]
MTHLRLSPSLSISPFGFCCLVWYQVNTFFHGALVWCQYQPGVWLLSFWPPTHANSSLAEKGYRKESKKLRPRSDPCELYGPFYCILAGSFARPTDRGFRQLHSARLFCQLLDDRSMIAIVRSTIVGW